MEDASKLEQYYAAEIKRLYEDGLPPDLSESPIERAIYSEFIMQGVGFDQQVQIGNYRVDFLVGNIVVECDGQAYHENRFEEDRQRDRYLQGKGYSVLRFTGREILKDARKCVNEIVRQIKER